MEPTPADMQFSNREILKQVKSTNKATIIERNSEQSTSLIQQYFRTDGSGGQTQSVQAGPPCQAQQGQPLPPLRREREMQPIRLRSTLLRALSGEQTAVRSAL